MNLKEQRAAAVKSARGIAEAAKAAGRDLYASEAAQIDRHLAEADRLKSLLDNLSAGRAITDQLEKMAPSTGGSPLDDGGGVAAAPESGRFALATAGGRKSAAAGVARAMRPAAGLGQKAGLISSGTDVVSTVVADRVHEQGRRPVSLLEVLPVVAHDSPSFAFLRQNERDFAAAPVEMGAVKPTSALGLERVESSLAVVAHLSDGVDKYALADALSLQRFVSAELLYGLNLAVEAAVLNGAPGIDGLADASGTGSVDFDTDVATSVRRAVTSLETSGHEAGAVVLTPAAWEAAELATATGSGEYHLGSAPVDRAARRMWGVPVVVSAALGDGEGYVLDLSSVALDTDRAGATVEWSDSSGDDFSRNLLRARCEGRFNLSVFQPSGVVAVGTSGDASGEG